MKKPIAILIILSLSIAAMGQNKALKEVNISAANIKALDVSIDWGIINIEQTTNKDSIHIMIEYDNPEKKDLNVGAAKLKTIVNDNILFVSSPHLREGSFESYQVTIKVHPAVNLKLKMYKGGEIYVKDIDGSIEIDNYNGSTRVEGASSWLTINNWNGEINVSYRTIALVKAISLITYNGGIKLALPEIINSDVILQTKKNGWIHSDFRVISAEGIPYTNMVSNQYAKKYVQWNGRIGKGGAKIMAFSHNGPIEILEAK